MSLWFINVKTDDVENSSFVKVLVIQQSTDIHFFYFFLYSIYNFVFVRVSTRLGF